ncbi:MAG TPA: L-serine ammonia-lyase, partial [Rhodobacteraceae bacterium]|nr:L-serine ammonia-lyase [Paracoccaceae bacterium]
MFLSVFDMFKVGVGPSSSHTMGPMVAAGRFLDLLRASPFQAQGLRASLHGSLAFTGVGHATDRATILGLAGFQPETYDADQAEAALADIKTRKQVHPDGLSPLNFNPSGDLVFDYDHPLPGHANGMILMATDAQGDVVLQETYYSIGGGFVVTEAEQALEPVLDARDATRPYPFETAQMMLDMAAQSGKTIAEMKRINELTQLSASAFDSRLARIWDAMEACINRGLSHNGTLPGGLNVKRRARDIHQSLLAEHGMNLTAPHTINDWMCVYAMAVNEENAAGGQVVTAPTNGAAGVVPAVIRYWLDHVPGASRARIPEFLLTASAIGGLIKHNASISGAECGCQAEIGSASAMAAAGLCA